MDLKEQIINFLEFRFSDNMRQPKSREIEMTWVDEYLSQNKHEEERYCSNCISNRTPLTIEYPCYTCDKDLSNFKPKSFIVDAGDNEDKLTNQDK